jgi:transposase-like protein
MPKPVHTPSTNQVTPDPALEKRTRRRFSAEYKLRIIAEADRCPHGEIGELLRREKLYSSQLQQWRRELAEKGAEGLSKTTSGPAPKHSAEQKRIAQLERENATLQRRLRLAEDCLELQKKTLSILDQMNNGNSA